MVLILSSNNCGMFSYLLLYAYVKNDGLDLDLDKR